MAFHAVASQTWLSNWTDWCTAYQDHWIADGLVDLAKNWVKMVSWKIVFRVHLQFNSVQLLSCVWLFVTPWTSACQASLSITNSQSLLKLMSIMLVIPFNQLIFCHPHLLPPPMFPSIRVFSELVLPIRWPKDWSFSFSISPFNEYSGLISFRMVWFDHFAVQGTLKSSPTPQFKRINSWVLSFLYSPPLTSIHDYWKIIALTRWNFVGK